MLLLIFLANFSILNATNDSLWNFQTFALVETWVDAQREFERLPGISLVVIEDGEMIWSAAMGYSNLQERKRAETSTLYSICSISKLFTSIAVMKLYEEGKLRLDDRVEDLLPWFDLKQVHEKSGPLTVRRILTHSSGLPREADAPYWTGPDFPFPDMSTIIDRLKNQETLYPAANFFQYSNLGMALLGAIVEEVSGENFSTYVEENILQPLGLEHTFTSMPENLHGNRLAYGYGALNREGDREPMPFFDAKGLDAAAGFASSAKDLGKFASWQLRLLESDKAEVLKPSTLDYMHRVHWTDPDWSTTWGLGFVVTRDGAGATMVGHGGSCPGYRSGLSIFPSEKSAVAVMINAGGTNPGLYINGIRGIRKKTAASRQSLTVEEDETWPDFSEYNGFYQGQPWVSEMYIGALGNGIVLMTFPANDPASAMTVFKKVGEDRFVRMRDDGETAEELVFVRDKDGEILRFERHGTYYPKLSSK